MNRWGNSIDLGSETQQSQRFAYIPRKTRAALRGEDMEGRQRKSRRVACVSQILSTEQRPPAVKLSPFLMLQ